MRDPDFVRRFVGPAGQAVEPGAEEVLGFISSSSSKCDIYLHD